MGIITDSNCAVNHCVEICPAFVHRLQLLKVTPIGQQEPHPFLAPPSSQLLFKQDHQMHQDVGPLSTIRHAGPHALLCGIITAPSYCNDTYTLHQRWVSSIPELQ
jgi:hypothetical protein